MVVAQWSHPITGYRGSRPSIDNFSTTLISCKLLKDKNKEKEVGNGPLKNTKKQVQEDYLHEGLLEGKELAELYRGGEDSDGQNVVVVRVDRKRRVHRDVLVTPVVN